MKTIIKIIGIASIALLVIGGFILYARQNTVKPLQSNQPEKSGTAETATKDSAIKDKVVENISKGTLPAIGTNPLEKKPDLNPVQKTNPYANIKTNPFK